MYIHERVSEHIPAAARNPKGINRAAAASAASMALLGIPRLRSRSSCEMDRECPWEGPPRRRQAHVRVGGRAQTSKSGVFVRDIYQVAKKGGRFTSTRAQGGVSRSNRITTFFLNCTHYGVKRPLFRVGDGKGDLFPEKRGSFSGFVFGTVFFGFRVSFWDPLGRPFVIFGASFLRRQL